MTNTTKLRALAEHARDNPGDTADQYAFNNAANPQAVIALLDELEAAGFAGPPAEVHPSHMPTIIDVLETERDEACLQLAASQAECERLRGLLATEAANLARLAAIFDDKERDRGE